MTSLSYKKSYRVTEKNSPFDCHQYCMSLPDLRFGKNRKRKAISLFRHLTPSRRQISTSGQIYRQVEWKIFTFTINLPNGNKSQVLGQTDETIRDLVWPFIQESKVNQPSLRLAKNDALIDIDAKAYHLENEEIILKESCIDKTIGQDARFAILEELFLTEADYQLTLQSLKSVYAQPLSNSTYLTEKDCEILFDWIDPILSASNELQTEIRTILKGFETNKALNGNLFSNRLWTEYEKYLKSFQTIWALIESKDEEVDLISVCRHFQGPILHSIDHLFRLPLDRISHYDNYIGQLVSSTSPGSPDYMDLCQWNEQSKSMVKESYSLLLRRKMSKCVHNNIDSTNKKMKKGRRTTINWPFKKSPNSKSQQQINESQFDGPTSPASPGNVTINNNNNANYGNNKSSSAGSNICLRKLFGSQMSLTCKDDNTLVPPVHNLLKQLYIKGPSTVGIFRKSANTRICRELKTKLEENPDMDLDDYPVTAIASVFKELLRSLPDGLLESKYLNEWMAAISCSENGADKSCRIKILLDKLKPANLTLLKYFICVLWRIAQQSNENMMSSNNLAVCIGPSVLADNSQLSVKRCEEISKLVPKLIAYLIDHALELFGPSITTLFGPPMSPASDNSKQDSGAEESDSLNSLNEGGPLTTNGHHNHESHSKRDDDSIESFERIMGEESPSVSRGSPCKRLSSPLENKMSLSNLSRDSGLTLSDTQLYNPEDGESSESSSDNCLPPTMATNRLHPHLTKSVPHLDTTNYENAINVTFSYGRSVGVSIDGSCHDVVRKRRHNDPLARSRINSTNSSPATHHSLLYHPHHHPQVQHHHVNGSNNSNGVDNNGPDTNHYHHYLNGNGLTAMNGSTNRYAVCQQPNKPGLSLLAYSKSYSSGININEETENYDSNPRLSDMSNLRYPRNGPRYRHRRPPLTAVLGGSHNTSYANGESRNHHRLCGLRKSASEESLVMEYENDNNLHEPISLPYHLSGVGNVGNNLVRADQINSAKFYINGMSKQSTTVVYPTSSPSTSSPLSTPPSCSSSSSASSSLSTSSNDAGESLNNSSEIQVYCKLPSVNPTASTAVTNSQIAYYSNSNNNKTTNGSSSSESHSPSTRKESASSSIISETCCNSSQLSSTSSVGSKSIISHQTSSSSSFSATSSSSSASLRSSSLSVSPPSYHETMIRKEMLARAQSKSSSKTSLSASSSSAATSSAASTTSVLSQPSPVTRTLSVSTSSSKIFEQSLRLYHQDLKNGTNVIIRAVPVRVNNSVTDSDNSDNEVFNGLMNNKPRKQTILRACSERKPEGHAPIHVTGSLYNGSNNPRLIHRNHLNSHQQGVFIQERCAKDLTDDWRKDINWSVAQLRTLFNGQRTGGGKTGEVINTTSPSSATSVV